MVKEKLLIIEDDIDTQKFLKLLLQKYYELDICWSDNSFYELLTKNSYDLIIMDISIKGRKDGTQLTHEIKNSQLYNHIPVICLSAHVLYQDIQNAYDAGVDIFLGKPVSNEILLRTIKDILNKHKT
ncbi:MAG: response regulator [Ignavibacteriaceae bacterium]